MILQESVINDHKLKILMISNYCGWCYETLEINSLYEILLKLGTYLSI